MGERERENRECSVSPRGVDNEYAGAWVHTYLTKKSEQPSRRYRGWLRCVFEKKRVRRNLERSGDKRREKNREREKKKPMP